MMSKLTICGGGNAAHVLIALAAQAGWEVNVFTSLADEANRLKAGIAARGGVVARYGGELVLGQPQLISANAADVIPGSEVVLLALPAFAHGAVLEAIASNLEAGAIIGALPARGGFDYQAFSIFQAKKRAARLFGLQTLPWACRIVTYGQEVEILGRKAAVDLAAYPAADAHHLASSLAPLLGVRLRPVTSFLTLTLANPGQLIHPGIMYGLGRGKEGVTFTQAETPLFYQGVDQPTADLLQAMSDEVQALVQQLSVHLPNVDPQEIVSIHTWLLRAYPGQIDDGSTLRRAFNTNRAYSGLKMPTRTVGPNSFVIDYQDRYLAEDVPFGLVVLKGIAELAGVSMPTLDQVIDWAQTRLNRQYLIDGTLCGADLAATRAPQRYGLQTLGELAAPTSELQILSKPLPSG
jgi:hypothetical protein